MSELQHPAEAEAAINKRLREVLADLIEDAPRQYQQLQLAQRMVEYFCDTTPPGYTDELTAIDPIVLRTNTLVQMLVDKFSLSSQGPSGQTVDYSMIAVDGYNMTTDQWLCQLRRKDNARLCKGAISGRVLVTGLRNPDEV